MPELPEVENIVKQLQEKAVGLVLSHVLIKNESVLGTDKKFFESKLPKKSVQKVSRRGKYIQFSLDHETSLWFHLGMTGQLLWSDDETRLGRHVHLIVCFLNLTEKLVFRDIRRFGEVFITNGSLMFYPEGLRCLGPEPFDLSAQDFSQLLKRRTGRIKSLLLNQRIIAGIGNIYADESLFRSGIHPKKIPSRLKHEKIENLRHSICDVLKEAIELGGSSIDDYLHTDGSKGFFQKFHRVYGREGLECINCKTVIKRIKLAGRSSFFCPQCQK